MRDYVSQTKERALNKSDLTLVAQAQLQGNSQILTDKLNTKSLITKVDILKIQDY